MAGRSIAESSCLDWQRDFAAASRPVTAPDLHRPLRHYHQVITHKRLEPAVKRHSGSPAAFCFLYHCTRVTPLADIYCNSHCNTEGSPTWAAEVNMTRKRSRHRLRRPTPSLRPLTRLPGSSQVTSQDHAERSALMGADCSEFCGTCALQVVLRISPCHSVSYSPFHNTSTYIYAHSLAITITCLSVASTLYINIQLLVSQARCPGRRPY